VRARAYGVYGESCDGNDLFAVLDMTKRAVEHARAGGGAALLEVLTYRRKGHAEHDAQQYVPSGEIESWEARDPIERFERHVVNGGILNADDLSRVRDSVAAEVEEARSQAEASPLPPAEQALERVCAGLETRSPWTRRTPPDPRFA
jgi:pyruvate dehydrogenase E1 component alpha subunit/2-oxoisovalerate dehydrogenase E1 component alpha subunit